MLPGAQDVANACLQQHRPRAEDQGDSSYLRQAVPEGERFRPAPNVVASNPIATAAKSAGNTHLDRRDSHVLVASAVHHALDVGAGVLHHLGTRRPKGGGSCAPAARAVIGHASARAAGGTLRAAGPSTAKGGVRAHNWALELGGASADGTDVADVLGTGERRGRGPRRADHLLVCCASPYAWPAG